MVNGVAETLKLKAVEGGLEVGVVSCWVTDGGRVGGGGVSP